MSTSVSIRKRTTSSKEIVLRKFSLSYSRTTHDQRIYNVHTLILHPFEVLVQRCKPHQLDLDDAKRRIYKTRHDTFRYRPSREYLDFINRLRAMKIIAVA